MNKTLRRYFCALIEKKCDKTKQDFRKVFLVIENIFYTFINVKVHTRGEHKVEINL